jgi:NACalpha-BTF3-like transcription factor
MKILGISHEVLPEVDRVVVLMKDGSWLEFDGAQVMKLTLGNRPLIQIRGEPKRAVDFHALFAMFPEECKYL